ncbi:MAG: AMP-binding protein [Deltaproteobacteria bacterium]|nr:AMP-binding protein [Deltaproteobacteria bacterium]
MNTDRAITGDDRRGLGDAWLWQRARLTPSAAALHFGGEVHDRATCDASCRFDYAALAREAEAVALRLLWLGVARGDRVAACMASHPRLVALAHAAQKLGAVLVPLSTRLGAAELGTLLAHAEPRLLLLDATAPLRGEPGGLARGAVCLDVHDALDRVAIAKSAALPSHIDAQAAWMILYTSGTTALPKGVVLTSANHFAAATASRRRLGHGAGDVWLATLPLYHVGGLAILARAVLEGSSVDLEDGFDIERVRSAIEDGPATMISLVPTMLARVLDSLRGRAHARLRCLLIGGAALSPALARKALEAGLPIAASYGLTEACSQLCTTEPGSAGTVDGSVGIPLPGVEVCIDSPAQDGVGELLARGANVTRGYFRNEEADAAAFGAVAADSHGDANPRKDPHATSRPRWLHTGDLASIDARGRVHIACRRTDLIVSGGENVAPAQVEAVLEEHVAVRECAVFGIDDCEWGQRVVALIALRGGREHAVTTSAEELTAWCRARLAAYKTPRLIRFVSALPRNASGKIDRRRLAQAWAEAAD